MRKLTIPVLFLISAALLATSAFWLPRLLDFVTQDADTIQGLQALVSLVQAAITGVLGYLAWVNFAPSKEPPLTRIRPEALEERLFIAPVAWVERDTVSSNDLSLERPIALIGERKVGKSRLAYEIIRQACTHLVSAERVFLVNPGLVQSAQKKEIQQALGNDRTSRALALIDDLPRSFDGPGLERLKDAMRAMKEWGAVYVIVTARKSQMTGEHSEWLEKEGFQCIEVAPFDREQTRRMAENCARLLGLTVEREALEELAAHGDGTPELTYLQLSRIANTKVKSVDLEAARRLRGAGLDVYYRRWRQEIENRSEAAGRLLRTLGVFYAARSGRTRGLRSNLRTGYRRRRRTRSGG